MPYKGITRVRARFRLAFKSNKTLLDPDLGWMLSVLDAVIEVPSALSSVSVSGTDPMLCDKSSEGID